MTANETDKTASMAGNPASPVRPVPQSSFCVSDIALRDRFSVWKESISCIFDVELDRTFPKRDFRAQLDASLFGDLMLARTSCSGQSWTRSAPGIARDGMDHYMIQFFDEGGMEAVYRRGGASVRAGALVAFDLSQEMSSTTPDMANLSLILPREMLAGQIDHPDDQHMRVLPAKNPLVSLLREYLAGLERMKDFIPVGQTREIASATAGLVAACLNGCGVDAPVDAPQADVPRTILVKRLIERNLSDPALSVERIAAMAGLSRTRLYTLFEPMGGVKGYVRERRLRRALGVLLDPRKRYRPIYEIGAECGFTNESAFSRGFRQRFGCSPREARENAAVPLVRRAGTVDGRRYEDWLHHLAA